MAKIGFLSLALCLAAAPARAVPGERADSALAAFNAVYWNASGKYFHKTDNKSGRLDFWMAAHAWEAILEAYERTGLEAYRNQAAAVYDGFVAHHGSDWTRNDYNDDILWWVIACARAYEITKDKRYLDQAKKQFDWVYDTQTDTVFGGGIWWRNDEHKTKNSCVVQPGIISALFLHKLLGDASYRVKAESLYAWQKRTLTEPGGRVYDAINYNGLDKGSTTYNQGTFIGSAQMLGKIADAEKAADWAKANLCDAKGIIRNNTQGDFGTFAQILARYVVRLGRRPGGERYLAWMEANAEAAWANRRRRDHITGFNWAAAAPDTGIQSQSAVGGVALLGLLAMPATTGIRLAPAGAATGDGTGGRLVRGAGLTWVTWRGSARAADGRAVAGPRALPAAARGLPAHPTDSRAR